MLAQRDWTDKIDKKTDKDSDSPDVTVRVKDFITQRENPQMTLVQPTLDVERNELTLMYTPDPAHKLVLPLDMERYLQDHPNIEATLPVVQTIIWGSFVKAYDLQSLARYYYNGRGMGTNHNRDSRDGFFYRCGAARAARHLALATNATPRHPREEWPHACHACARALLSGWLPGQPYFTQVPG